MQDCYYRLRRSDRTGQTPSNPAILEQRGTLLVTLIVSAPAHLLPIKATFSCTCEEQYMGTFCEEYDACQRKPCRNNASCIDANEKQDGSNFTCVRLPVTITSLLNKPKSEVTPEELQKREGEEFNMGPLSALTQSIKNNTQGLLNCHSNKKLLDPVKVSDRHCNMVLENEKEMRTEVPKSGRGKKKSKPVDKDCYIAKMFLCGNWAIVVLQHPLTASRQGPPIH
ncbi:small nuclear ribonucleoprotein Sm D2-like [Cebus imitator]|uniref:small nuclear ribonucleoprotein Sm D2-like n=1 Tax=Cebus imitator TaxID=2715852 RepID=UPI001898D2E6|nr:small nuclear ribonucleoprotein Sm D2-like [Cebus imitator]